MHPDLGGGGYLRGPPLEGGDGEEGHHRHVNVVKVEVTVVPVPGLLHRQGCVTVGVQDEGAPVGMDRSRRVNINTHSIT